MTKEKSFYEQSKTRVLDNSELAAWLREIEDKVKKQ